MSRRIDAGVNPPLQHCIRLWVSAYIHGDIPMIRKGLEKPLNGFNSELKVSGEIVVTGEAVSYIIAQRRDLRIKQLGVGRQIGVITDRGRKHGPVAGLSFLAQFGHPPCQSGGRYGILWVFSWWKPHGP